MNRGSRRILARAGRSLGGRVRMHGQPHLADRTPQAHRMGGGSPSSSLCTSAHPARAHPSPRPFRKSGRHGKKNRRSRRHGKFRKYCMNRAKRLGTRAKRGSPFDLDNRPSQCPRCDRGQHRRCVRLPHCRAGFRSPHGVNRRELNRAAARAQRQQRRNGARRRRSLPARGRPHPDHPCLRRRVQASRRRSRASRRARTRRRRTTTTTTTTTPSSTARRTRTTSLRRPRWAAP